MLYVRADVMDVRLIIIALIAVLAMFYNSMFI